MSVTILEILVQRLRATADGYHAGAEEAPVAILWTDPDGVWTPVVVQLQGLMPELLMLGDYAPQERKGPVIWLKCAIAGTIKEVEIPKTVVPVLYLPGVARHHLRAADQCSPELQPLVELLYRGTIWTHPNGRDWTLEAFFQADEGLGLDVAGDEKTRDSLRAAITMLAKTPVDQLRNKGRLESADFDDIVVGDTPRDLLTWLGSPDTVRKEWGEERWHAFRSRCRDKYEFDPEKEPPLYAAERLGRREADAWRQLWGRFCEAPGLYSGVRVALDQAQPSDILALDPESWPAENEKQENELRTALSSLEQKAPHTARHELNHLEKEHAPRRSWVWAKLDEAPLSRSMAALHHWLRPPGRCPPVRPRTSWSPGMLNRDGRRTRRRWRPCGHFTAPKTYRPCMRPSAQSMPRGWRSSRVNTKRWWPRTVTSSRRARPQLKENACCSWTDCALMSARNSPSGWKKPTSPRFDRCASRRCLR